MLRYLHYLRIAFSATCGIACVLLIVLWVRTYRYQDHYVGWVTTSRMVDSTSWHGWISLNSIWFDTKHWDAGELPAWEADSHFIQPDPIRGPRGLALAPPPGWTWDIYSRPTDSHFVVVIPCWLPVLLSATLTAVAAAPWLRLRFSVRTLLIATTLVAMVLGLIVYAVR